MLAILAAAALADPYAALRTVIPARMAEFKVPGAALAIFRGGKVVFRQGFGTTERGGGRRVDGNTVFEAASLTKPVFAAAVLKLAAQGKIDLDVPLVRYFGGKYVHQQQPWNPNGKTDTVEDPRIERITARHVLVHRTGLTNIAFNRPLNFVGDPGGPWGYSGEGYIMLQRAVERLMNRPAAEIVGDLVLKPRRMNRSGLVFHPEMGSNAAKGVTSDGGIVDRMGQNAPLVAGALLSTLDDFARFMIWSTKQKPFTTPLVEADAKAGLDWGMGWGLARDGKDHDLFQWGWNDGYRNFALLNPRTGDGMLLFTSSDDGMELVPLILPIAMGRTLPILAFSKLGLRANG